MNNNVKGIIFFFSGMTLGAAGGGYAVYKYAKRYFEVQKQEAINELAEYYHNKYNDIPVKEVQVGDESPIKKKSNDEVKTETEKTYEEMAGIYKPIEEEHKVVTDYRSISGGNSSDDGRPASKKKSKKKKPYLIDQDIWDANDGDYDKMFIKYYEADNVLIDEETDSPVDILNELGSGNLNNPEDEDYVYIANDQMKSFYMVTFEHGAWSEEGL